MRAALCVLLLVLCGAAGLADEKVSERLAVSEGETCVVCSRPVTGAGAAYRAGGQRVPVCEMCEDKFLEDPDGHMASMRPSSMIFGAVTETSLSGGWIWLGVFALVGLIFGGLSAHLAVRKGYPLWTGFLLGFLLSLPGYLFLVSRPAVAVAVPPGLAKVPVTHDPVACPQCGHSNHPSASACSGCGAALEASVVSELEVLGKD